MTDRPWELVHTAPILQSPWLQISRNSYRLPSGAVIEDYYVVERDSFVLVVAKRKEELLLVRQYRPATGKTYLSLPAGYLRPDESPVDCAKRELMEETGHDATDATLIGELHPLPGYIRSTAFVVTCRAVGEASNNIDTEEIDAVIPVTFDRALEMIRKGEINEMQAVSAILLAAAIET